MRRDSRRKQDNLSKNKTMLYTGITLIVVIVAAISFVMYGGQTNNNSESKLSSDKIATLVPNNEIENTQSASSTLGKSIEQAEMEENMTSNSTSEDNTTSNTVKESTNTTKTTGTTKSTNSTNTTKSTTKTKQTNSEPKKEITFTKPVKGEIVKEYAKDHLIYSNTLKEWVTHLGVDIKADKTTVVKAAAEGTVKSIKNDPRYGLTVVINHGDGLQSVYANLLTSEFVVEGEKVKQGQSIGTVGNSAVFEIADEPHLHFEILKNNTQVDPTIYIK